MNKNICACKKKKNKCWLTIMTSLAVKSLKQVDSTTEFWPHGDRSKFFICIMRGCRESETSKKATGPKAWVYDSCKTTGRASIFWSKFWIANLNVFTKENRKAGRQERLCFCHWQGFREDSEQIHVLDQSLFSQVPASLKRSAKIRLVKSAFSHG